MVVADDGLAPLPHLFAEDLGGGGGVPVVQVGDAVGGDEHHLGGGVGKEKGETGEG